MFLIRVIRKVYILIIRWVEKIKKQIFNLFTEYESDEEFDESDEEFDESDEEFDESDEEFDESDEELDESDEEFDESDEELNETYEKFDKSNIIRCLIAIKDIESDKKLNESHIPRTLLTTEKEDLSFKYQISISYPKLLSKRFTAPIIVRVYPEIKRNDVEIQLTQEDIEWGLKSQIFESNLVPGVIVNMKLSSQVIKFSDTVVIELKNSVNKTAFTAMPDDNCHPGIHTVILTITDNKTGVEYESIVFNIHVVDFVVDHLSRPFLSNILSILLGIGSLTVYILTLLGQIDSTFGLSTGTAAGALATFIYSRIQQLYKHPSKIVTGT